MGRVLASLAAWTQSRRGRDPPQAALLEPPPEPEPEPEPKRWNLWDLERMRPAHDDERTFLLVYLRGYADPDGALPATFDLLVRETFGDLIGSAAR